MQHTLFDPVPPPEELEPTSVGELLKEARKSQGISLETVCQQLRIHRLYLIKLEEDDQTLVCDVYTLGFLRSYGEFLGLDPHLLIQKFKGQVSDFSLSALDFPSPSPERGVPSVRILIVSGFFFICVVLFGAYQYWRGLESECPQILTIPQTKKT